MHSQTIDSFFDTYCLSHARSLLGLAIKTASSQKIWKSTCPANLLYFTQRLEQLAEAAFAITERYDYHDEVILKEEAGGNKLWLLQEYQTYCGWHSGSDAWDFFPRHLSKKEFLDPYKALEKFTRYRSLYQWKMVIKEILEHGLSPQPMQEFDDGTSIISTWVHLHKLVEAAHLIEVRSKDKEIRPRRKWKKTKTHS